METILVFILLQMNVMYFPLNAELFNFYLSQTRQSFNKSKELCKNLGYDGLAITKSPEEYAYLERISKPSRRQARRGVYVGLRFRSDKAEMTWEDDTLPTPDMPWYEQCSQKDQERKPYGYFYNGGALKITHGRPDKFALCGNYKNQPTEAHGITLRGRQPTGVTLKLGVTSAPSFLECALACAQDYMCRVAEFISDSFTCTTLGPGSYTGFIENAQSYTFIRNGFS